MTTLARYGVIGRAVENSLSPIIHQLFAKQTRKKIEYLPYSIAHKDFITSVNQLRQQGIGGLNVTMPFKTDAFKYAQQHTERAQLAEAVNTLYFHDDIVSGDNTDGAGLINDLHNNLQWPIRDAQILVLGAGGAVNGLLGHLLINQPAKIHIANRTHKRAVTLAKQFTDKGAIVAVEIKNLPDYLPQMDIVLCAIAHDCTDWLTWLPTDQRLCHTVCYDLAYQHTPTPFMLWATQCRAQAIIDGLGMLVEQAGLAFTYWHDITVATQPVLAQLRS